MWLSREICTVIKEQAHWRFEQCKCADDYLTHGSFFHTLSFTFTHPHPEGFTLQRKEQTRLLATDGMCNWYGKPSSCLRFVVHYDINTFLYDLPCKHYFLMKCAHLIIIYLTSWKCMILFSGAFFKFASLNGLAVHVVSIACRTVMASDPNKDDFWEAELIGISCSAIGRLGLISTIDDFSIGCRSLLLCGATHQNNFHITSTHHTGALPACLDC